MDVRPLSDSVKSPLGIARYHENGEWDLIDEKVIQRTVYHAFSNDTVFSELAYTLWLRRKPLYYIANFIIPCVLIALVTILLFLIPPGKLYASRLIFKFLLECHRWKDGIEVLCCCCLLCFK